MGCVVKTLPEFKNLEKVYGTALAQSFVINYSISVMKLSPDKDYYYPTRQEVKDWLATENANTTKNITSALTINPYLSEQGIKSILNKVVHTLNGKTYITRGSTNYGSTLENAAAKNLIYDPNLALMTKLAKDFPNIFELKDSQYKADTKEVIISPITDRDDAENTRERAISLDAFMSEFPAARRTMENERALQIATRLGEKLEKALGVPYTFVNAVEAAEILADSVTPYDNQPAFYYNNQVYFVGDYITPDIVLHEYAHPLIKAIGISNPKLFDNLYNQLGSTATGREVINNVTAKYPELSQLEDQSRFKEECLVTALEKAGTAKVNELASTETGFRKLINNLIYAIKQVLKSLSKKVNLKTLSENTTLDQLADMMVSEDFVVDKIVFDESDYAEFKKDFEGIIDEFKVVAPENLQEAINNFYNTMRYMTTELSNNPDRVKKELLGKDGVRILKDLQNELRKYQTVDVNVNDVDPEAVIRAAEDQNEDFRLKVLNLVRSIEEIEKFAENTEKVINTLSKSNMHLQADTISRISYFENVLDQTGVLVDAIRQTVGLNKTNDFVKRINSVKTTIEDVKHKVKSLKVEFTLEFLNDESLGMKENIEKLLKDNISRYFKKVGLTDQDVDTFTDAIINSDSAPSFEVEMSPVPIPDRIKSYVKTAVNEYYYKRLGKDQLEDYITGIKGDMGFLDSMFAPYMNMNDPVIGTFARFINKHTAKYLREALEKRDKFTEALVPDLKAVGFNRNNMQATAKKVFFVDKTGYRDNKTGEYKEFEKWKLINKHKNWEYDLGKLKNDYESAIESKDRDKVRAAYTALEELNEKYMYRKYKKEVYDLRKMWNQENEVIHPETGEKIIVDAATSFEAYTEKLNKLSIMNTIRNMEVEELEDVFKITQGDAAALDYKRLTDIKNPDGTMKTGKELEKVLVRKKYNALSNEYYETDSDVDRAQNDLNNFVLKLASVGITPTEKPDEFAEEMAKYERVNFRVAYTAEYYKLKRETGQQISEILNKPNRKDLKVAQELADLYQERFQLSNLITDRNGQTNALQYKDEDIKRVNEIEKKIVELEAKFDKYTGLSKEDSNTLRNYEDQLAKGILLSKEDTAEYEALLNTKNTMGIGTLEMQKLKELFKTMKDLKVNEPTDYYIEAFNFLLRGLGIEDITITDAEDWINSPKVIDAMTKSDDFKNWFRMNHYEKEVYDPITKQMGKRIYRTSIWTVARPVDEASYKITELVNPATGEPLIIKGVPSAKYTIRKVKDEYKTGYDPKTKTVNLIVGKHITNKSKNDFLPRDYKPGDAESAADSLYMNERYTELERQGGADFKLLQTLTKQALELQESGNKSARLYLDLPRFYHRTRLELIQSGKALENIKSGAQNIKTSLTRTFSKEKLVDAASQNMNYNPETSLIATNMNGEPISRIPIQGLYKLDVGDVSLDFLSAYGHYLDSLIQQKALSEVEPIHKIIGDVLKDPENAIKDIRYASKQVKKSKGILAFTKMAGDNRRVQAFDYFVDKMFYGKKNSNFEEENVMTTKIANKLMHVASRSIIGFDMVSAAKQRFGQKFQNMVEAAGGKDVTFKSLATGKTKSLKAVFELSTQGIYAMGPKSLAVQMIEYFDPITGKTRQDFHKSASRSIAKDFLDGSWMYDTRKLAEVEGVIALFYGMMDNKFIEQKDANGNVTKIKYSEAFKLNDKGIISLKEGIDPEWGPHDVKHEFATGDTLESIAARYSTTPEKILKKNKIEDLSGIEPGQELTIATSELFDDFRLRIQGRSFKLNGMIDTLNSPQASKYLAYRMFTFYKNFATGFMLNRFQMDTKSVGWTGGGDVYDWNLNEVTKGYYVAGFQGIIKLLKTVGKDWPLLSDDEKSGIYKMLMEVGMVALLGLAVGLLFGYDPDDEERFAKLKEREEKYGQLGFLSNHLLYQIMAVKSENEAFIPIVGTSDMLGLVSNTSIALGTVKNMLKIAQDLYQIATGDESAYYKQDVGPYAWQEEGDAKLWNHIGAIWGVKGKNASAIYAIKSKETAENLGF